LNEKTLALGALLSTLLLSGCITDTRVAAGPVRANTVVVAPPPPPPAVVVAEPVYVPEPHDAYISVALDTDVVFISGNTYIWYVGQDGRRYRHFYGRGDLRGEVLHRRAQLRIVMAHHQGHLPMQNAHMVPPPAKKAMPAHAAHAPQAQPQPQLQAHAHAQQAGTQQAHKPAPTTNRVADERRRDQPRT
jgi:hypothetical protein